MNEYLRQGALDDAQERIRKLENLVKLITTTFRVNVMRNSPEEYTHAKFDALITQLRAEAGLK